MARRSKQDKVRPVDWKLAPHANGDYRNGDGLWRVVDGTGETIGLVNDHLCMVVFAHRHLLEITKSVRNLKNSLNALEINWTNSDHLVQGNGVGQLTSDMLKNGVWRVFCGLDEEKSEPTKGSCYVCTDTHLMPLGERVVMCTHCPVPCPKCQGNEGRGPYCASTPCPCECHNAKAVSRETEPRGAGESSRGDPNDHQRSSSTDAIHENGGQIPGPTD